MDHLELVTKGHFKKLWASQILSLIAYNLLNFALIIRVYELTRGSHFGNISVSLLVLSFGIPSVLFAAAAGVFVDQWDRRKVLVLSNATRTVLALLYLWIGNSLLLLLLLTFTMATVTQFFAPAEAAAIPRLVRRDHLISANALFLFTFYATFVVGYSSSAPIIRFFGSMSPYVFAAGLLGIATLLAVALPHMGEGEDSENPIHQDIRRVFRELGQSLKLIRSNINLYFPIIQLMLMQTMISLVMVLAPALSLAILKTQLQEASHLLILPAGLGMVIGVVVVNWVAKGSNKLRLISGGLVVAGAGLLMLGLTGQLYRQINGETIATTGQVGGIAAILLFALGIVTAIVSVASQTLLQENTDDKVRGKVFGALYTLINAASVLPVLVVGVLADFWSVTKVISALGAFVLVFAVAQFLYIKRSLKKGRPIHV